MFVIIKIMFDSFSALTYVAATLCVPLFLLVPKGKGDG